MDGWLFIQLTICLLPTGNCYLNVSWQADALHPTICKLIYCPQNLKEYSLIIFLSHLLSPPTPLFWSHWALQLSEGKLTVAFLHRLFMLCLCLATVVQAYSSSPLIFLPWVFPTMWSASPSHCCHNALSRLLRWPFANGRQAVAASSFSTFYQCRGQGL